MSRVANHSRIAALISASVGLACGPPSASAGGSESTRETTSTPSTETGDPDPTGDHEILDFPDDPGPDRDPLPDVQLIVALGSGSADGEASFGPAQRFSLPPRIGLTAASGVAGAPMLATWSPNELCVATVAVTAGVVSFEWRACASVDAIFDVARLDADADGNGELLVLSATEFLWFVVDPGAPTGLTAPKVIPNPPSWDRRSPLVTGDFDSMPGDEAVATGLEGDPVLGAAPSIVVVHAGASLAATVVAEASGIPYIAELTGDATPDLLIGASVWAGTNDVDVVDLLMNLTGDGDARWPMEANGDGVTDIVWVEPGSDDCIDPGQLTVYPGPFTETPPNAAIIDGTRIDPDAVSLVGDLNHDGVDELVSVGVDPWTCPTGGGWTLSSTGTGIGTSPVVELCDVDCRVVTAKLDAVDDRQPAAVELADLDGDGNLDLLVLVVLTGG